MPSFLPGILNLQGWPSTVHFQLLWSYLHEPARLFVCQYRGRNEVCALAQPP